MREGDAKQLGAFEAAVFAFDDHHGAVVDLGFLAGLDFHAPYALRGDVLEGFDETLNGVIGAFEGMLGSKVFVDALGVEALVELGFDPLLKRLAFALSARLIPGHRNGAL